MCVPPPHNKHKHTRAHAQTQTAQALAEKSLLKPMVDKAQEKATAQAAEKAKAGAASAS